MKEKMIVPAIIGETQKELDDRLTKVLPFFDLVQLDVMDNQFVPNASLFFDFKLPETTCCYTPLELDLALLGNDLGWLERLPASPERARLLREIRVKWLARLSHWSEHDLDENERQALAAARQSILSLSGS